MHLFSYLPTAIEYEILSYCPHPVANIIRNEIIEVIHTYQNDGEIEFPSVFFDLYVYKSLLKIVK